MICKPSDMTNIDGLFATTDIKAGSLVLTEDDMPDCARFAVTVSWQRDILDQVKAAQMVSMKNCDPLVQKMISASTPWQKQETCWNVDALSWKDTPPSPTFQDEQQDQCFMRTKRIYNVLLLTLFIKDDGNLLSVTAFYGSLGRSPWT